MSRWRGLVTGLAAACLLIALLTPSAFAAKAVIRAVTRDGMLLTYDPDTDQIVERKKLPAGEYLEEAESAVIDTARDRVVFFANPDAMQGDDPLSMPSIWVVDLRSGSTKQIQPPGPSPEHTYTGFRQFIYPAKASQFIVYATGYPLGSCRQDAWFRDRDSYYQVIDLDGVERGTTTRELCSAGPVVLHPDGRHFWEQPRNGAILRLVDGETLHVVTRRGMAPLGRQGMPAPLLTDARGDRALFAEGDQYFTTDLSFAPASASPRIQFNADPTRTLLVRLHGDAGPWVWNHSWVPLARLTPDGRGLVVAATQLRPDSPTPRRLHWWNVLTGASLGSTDLPPVASSLSLQTFHLVFDAAGTNAVVLEYLYDNRSNAYRSRLLVIDVPHRAVMRERLLDERILAVEFGTSRP